VFAKKSARSIQLLMSATLSFALTACGGGDDSDPSSGAGASIASECLFNGGTVANGSQVQAYAAAYVAYGSTCTAQTRVCSNGTLSGSYPWGTCQVSDPMSCVFGGNFIANGASVTAYATGYVAAGTACTSQTRVCNNGTLSGSYASSTCVVGTAPVTGSSGSTGASTGSSGSTGTVSTDSAVGLINTIIADAVGLTDLNPYSNSLVLQTLVTSGTSYYITGNANGAQSHLMVSQIGTETFITGTSAEGASTNLTINSVGDMTTITGTSTSGYYENLSIWQNGNMTTITGTSAEGQSESLNIWQNGNTTTISGLGANGTDESLTIMQNSTTTTISGIGVNGLVESLTIMQNGNVTTISGISDQGYSESLTITRNGNITNITGQGPSGYSVNISISVN
jgi:hypothetical protein